MLKKIPPYAGTAAPDTAVNSNFSQVRVEKSAVNAANPQETGSTAPDSSETLRGTSTPFNFDLFRANGRYLTTDLEWLIGFAEGDGSFIVSGDGWLRFQITQSVSDVQVLHRVRRILGFGTVRVQDAEKPIHAWCYAVTDRKNLRRLIDLFNGNLVMEKSSRRFVAFVTAFQARYKEDIVTVPTRVTPTLATAWLSGFTDAEGCFTVSVVRRPAAGKNPYRVYACYILTQKGAEEELRALALLLSGTVSFHKSYGRHNLRVRPTFLKKTLHYFRRFPLKSKKRISLIKFLTVYDLLIRCREQKRPLTEEELTLVRKRAKEINPDWRVTWRASTPSIGVNKIEAVVEDKVRPIK